MAALAAHAIGVFGFKFTWRADEEKARREAWEKACLAANMMTTID